MDEVQFGGGECHGARYISHFYCLAVEAGFYSDVVECLPVDPATWVRFPAGAGKIFSLYDNWNDSMSTTVCSRDRYITHFYCLVVEAGFYSDVVECLPVDPAAQVRLRFGCPNMLPLVSFSGITLDNSDFIWDFRELPFP